MSVEENKAYYIQFIEEVINGQNLDAINKFVHRDYFDHTPPRGSSADREGIRAGLGQLHTAFPDFYTSIELLVGEGDIVVGHHVSTGTHTDDFAGIPATGRQVHFTETHIVRIQNGQAIEHWSNSDDVAMLGQLGIIPPLPE